MAGPRRTPRPSPPGADATRAPSGPPTAQLADADALVRLARLIEAIHARVAQQHDLTPVQSTLLCILMFGPRTMSELARALGVEKAAVTGLIDRTESRGLLTREPVPGDRRTLNVVLTDTGRRTGQAFHAHVTTELHELLTPLSTPEHARFTRTLRRILNAAPTAGNWLTPPDTNQQTR